MPIYFLLSIWVFLSVGREPTPQAYFERGALFYNALTSPFRSGMISKRLARSSAAIRDAAPTGADFVLIEVAFRPQKSESWAHADGNEIPSPSHAGGVGPRNRPVEIWNSFAGVAPFTALKPVKKFTDRKVAVARIWEAVQVLPANVAKPAAHVAPEKGKQNKDAPKSKRRHTAPAAAKDPVNVAREGSKKAEVIDLMRRSQGATLPEIMELTGWQAHTVRRFVSGTLIKKLSLNVESFRSDEEERTYRVK